MIARATSETETVMGARLLGVAPVVYEHAADRRGEPFPPTKKIRAGSCLESDHVRGKSFDPTTRTRAAVAHRAND